MEIKSKTSWNDDCWDRTQTSAIRGICAIIIILHHMAQKTCAGWIPEEYTVHGLEPFLSAGYLMVGVFFFCSGYGLYVSVKQKPDYLDGFIGTHFRPIILVFIISNICYYLVGNTFSGYNWYVYAILYLYLSFYISFRFPENEKISVPVLSGFIALYILICELFVAGSWCYNTVCVFMVGLIFAEYREEITAFIRRRYPLFLILTALLFAVSFFGAEKLDAMTGLQEETGPYNALRFSAVFLQFFSSSLFSVLLFAINRKIRIRSRVFSFIGSMSLELYMIHVLYVEMFGYCFGYEGNGPVCYIRNLPLYIAAVLVFSLASAYALKYAGKSARLLRARYDHVFEAVRRDAKKVLIGILAAAAGITVFLAVSNAVKAPAVRQKAEDYKNENISFVRVDDADIAVYISGEGGRPVLVIRGEYDPCPTLTQKALADELAEEFRVIVPDFPGTGFSTACGSGRDIGTVCRELHGIAEELALKDYIILAEGTSSLYAQYYVNKYPGEVSCVVTLDAETAETGRAFLKLNRISVPQYRRFVRRDAWLNCLTGRLADILGYKDLIWPLYQKVYSEAVGWENDDVAKYIFFRNHENGAIRSERICEPDAYLAAEKLSYPADIEVLDFVSEGRIRDYRKLGIDITGYLDNLSRSCRNHRTVTLVDCSYCALFNPKVIRTNMSVPDAD